VLRDAITNTSDDYVFQSGIVVETVKARSRVEFIKVGADTEEIIENERRGCCAGGVQVFVVSLVDVGQPPVHPDVSRVRCGHNVAVARHGVVVEQVLLFSVVRQTVSLRAALVPISDVAQVFQHRLSGHAFVELCISSPIR